MKFFLHLVFMLVVISCAVGFYLQSSGHPMADTFIGAGISGLFFLWMPLFIYHRWKNRSVSDYMLTKESIEKMNDYKKTK